MKKILKPKVGLLVRDPFTKKILPEDGQPVDWNGRLGHYWRKRVMVGDCEIVDKTETEIKD